MKKNCILIALTLFFVNHLCADEFPTDSLKVVDIEEVIVVASPKENRKLREQPTAVTLFSHNDLQSNQVTSVKRLTGLVPNMFIPDYGSKLTSAIYIRGIGSRINTPSVGLYVDNVPYIDKSAFDFNYSDVERIDVLRGPQGTLYGRNTMGGLIRIHTKSPFSYQGTDVQLGIASRGGFRSSLTHYHRISDKFAFSAGGFYEYAGGFFHNSFQNNKKVDRVNDAGGRIRGIYFATENLKIDFSLNYEYSDQGGYPYFYNGAVNPENADENLNQYMGKIATNDPSDYRRNLFNGGFNIEYQAKNFIFNAVTGYQNLRDRMRIDQDFTPRDYFNLVQKQKYNTISEELVFKSKPGSNWQWTTGAFGFYQWLKTDGPVTFKREGIADIIEKNANSAFENIGGMPGTMELVVNNQSMLINDDFDTPTLNGAIFHQSTFNNLFVEGLSFTAGLRLDYEKMSMKYKAHSTPMDFDFNMSIPMGGPPQYYTDNMLAPAEMQGKLSNDYVQLLPKFSLQYEWKKNNSVYATVSRGYRSGGYNIQMFSDIIQDELQNSSKKALMESSVFGRFSEMIDRFMPEKETDVKKETTYKPEYSWNFEAGSHLTLWEGRLWADLAAFYMETRDQQLSQFASSGLGRITINAGKSHSYGVEAALRASVTERLSFNASYGYTQATFKEFQDEENKDLNYDGNYVPFVPKHTFNVGGQYLIPVKSSVLDQLQLYVNYAGAGRIYWTEQNNASQSFYGTLNGRFQLSKGNHHLAFWVQNILQKKYTAFYFESMGNGFMQKGRPFQCGIDVKLCF